MADQQNTSELSVGGGSPLPLHPEQLADLRERSGLSEQTILAAGIRSLAPGEWPRYLSQRLAPEVQTCYLIPYPEADGFYRVKLFPPISDKDGHTGSVTTSPPGRREDLPDVGGVVRHHEGAGDDYRWTPGDEPRFAGLRSDQWYACS